MYMWISVKWNILTLSLVCLFGEFRKILKYERMYKRKN